MYRLILFAAAILFGAGLGCADTSSPTNDAAGTYDLVSVNGFAIPGTVNLGGALDVTVDSGALRLEGNGAATLAFSSPQLGQASVSGSYSVNNDVVTVDLSDSIGNEVRGSGPLAGSSLTITDQNGVVWEFHRR